MPDLKVVTPTPRTRLESLVEDHLAHCRARACRRRRGVQLAISARARLAQMGANQSKI